ncbi:MAG: ribosome biogenesis GTPase YlqF [Thermostichales cyanobacterium DRC_bins_46]
MIQWYPGHIAKAQRQLQEQLQRVDVILEVLDARIPSSSRHPNLRSWAGSKPILTILNRLDQVPPEPLRHWQRWLQQQGSLVFTANGQTGVGIPAIRQGIVGLGEQVNQRRQQRGMLPRPVRAVVIGFPNVGKSAILNRLLGRRVVASARRPGVTRQLQWVRLEGDLHLLDTPGILPPVLRDQRAATKLAICDDIGAAAYRAEAVALFLLDLIHTDHPQLLPILQQRYGWTAEDPQICLQDLAARRYRGDQERAGQQLLKDFRQGYWGPLMLEVPPTTAELAEPGPVPLGCESPAPAPGIPPC